MPDTIFHKILSKEIPADVVYEDDEVLAFKDIHPKAPTHLLFIPKTFVPSIAECTGDKAMIPSIVIQAARKFAEQKGIEGYKLTFHVGPKGGQEVMYLHLHFMSEQKLS
jgi:histidine triad (HIT) family protein